MTGFPAQDCAAAVGWAAAAIVVVLAATFVASRIAHKHSVIDSAWGLLFAVAAVTAFAVSSGHGDALRRWLLLALTVVWGLRLAVHIGRRTIGKAEDPRYAAMLARAKGNPDLYALRVVYLGQGVLALLIAAPVIVGPFESGPVRALGWIGVALWCVGVFFELVGDLQMERFRADPAHHGQVIDIGLWRYTRHPNYFGDCCVWWGLFLIAAERWPGVLTIYAPVLMTFLLTQGSGVRLMEKHMAGRPGWSDYVARTSAFIPLPRRRPRGTQA